MQYVFGRRAGIDMLSLRRLGQVIIATVFVSILFFIHNWNENEIKKLDMENPLPVQARLLSNQTVNRNHSAWKFVVIGKDNKVRKNTIDLLDYMKVPYTTEEKAQSRNFRKDTILIFCSDKVGECSDLKELVTYIEQGGRMILASGLAEGNEDSYLQPVLGTIEKSIKENYQTFQSENGFWPFEERIMTYDGYNASTWIKVREDATVYLKDVKKNVPIVYEYPYQSGKTIVLNTTMLEDKKCQGILASAIGIAAQDFVYPVMNTKCIFLDNFPIVTYVNDEDSMALYGRTTENFVKNIVWPVFQGIAVRDHIRYTSGIMTAAGKKDVFPRINKNLFFIMGKSAMQFEGEIIRTGNFTNSEGTYFNEPFEEGFEEIFPNYQIRGFAVTEGKVTKDQWKWIQERYPHSFLMRSRFEEENPFADGQFPLMTKGLDLDGGSLFEIASMVASYGTLSHGFDVNQFIAEDKSSDWDHDKKQLEIFEKRVIRPLSMIESNTLSGTENKLDSYLHLSYEYQLEEDGIRVGADQFLKGQAFFIRTTRKIGVVKGGRIQKIGKNYYLFFLDEPHAFVSYK